jgi:tetratricopeptide (TPR) repeat protein
MVEDIITSLSRFSQLFVIARNSTFTYKGRAVDIRQVAKELGVRYVLEGGVRKSGTRLRITGQLIDAATGAHLWAARFDGAIEDVFDLQDRITEKVVGAIEPTLRKAEIERARRKPVENLDAYDLYLRALPHVYAGRVEENLTALKMLTGVIERDPGYALALAHAAWCYVQRISRGWPPFGEDDRGTAIALARRAAAAGGDDAVVLVLSAFVQVVARDYEASLSAARRAVALNPGSGFVNFMAGATLIWCDEAEDGLVMLERAMLLGPLDPSLFMVMAIAGAGHLCCGRPNEAAGLAQRAAALNPDFDSSYWVQCVAYVELGRLEEAHRALARFVSLAPGVPTASALRAQLPFRNQAVLDRIVESMRKAGLPE